MKKIPPSDMLEVRAKIAALTALKGERKDWGVGRAWERDYLANVRTLKQQQNEALHSHNAVLILKKKAPLSKMPNNTR